MLKQLTCVVVVLACVGIAYGGANKIRWFTACQAQIDESEAALGLDADPDGMAILNYASGADKTIVQIIVSDMTPSRTYSVRLTDGTPEDDVVVPDAFTTNEEGHGTFHQEFLDTNISTCHVELFVGTTTTGEIWSQEINRNPLPDPAVNTSSVDPDDNYAGSRAADNIDLAAGQEVVSIRWWGGWCFADPQNHDFRIRFYEDDGSGAPSQPGNPGNLVPGSEQFVTATRGTTSTGYTLPCGVDEFPFEAVLPVSFVAPAAGIYWVEVVGVHPFGSQFPLFVWSNTNSGDGSGRQKNAASSPWIIQPDRTFILEGETDTTELRAFGTNLEATSAPPVCP